MVTTRETTKPRTDQCPSNGTNRWEADGEPSSMDLLVQWLETLDNYDRWKRHNSSASEAAASFLKENGIDHRSAGAVGSKIRRSEQQWKDAHTWLTDSGLFDAYHRGDVDDGIRANVNILCPRYDRVSRVFRNGEEIVMENPDDDLQRERDSQLVTRDGAVETKKATEKKLCIEDEERQHRQELFKCDLEAKRVQADVEIVCARVLGRQRLLDAGVDPKVVDDVLPPP